MWRALPLVVVLVTGAVAGATATAPSVTEQQPQSATAAGGDTANQTACRQRYPRTTGTTEVAIRVTRGPTENSVRLQFPRQTPEDFDVILPNGTTVRNHSGFYARDGREYRAKTGWNHTLVYTFNETSVPGNTSRDRIIRPFEGATDWLLAPLPVDYDKHRYESVNVSYTSPQPAAFGEELVYIGAHDTYTRSRGCHTLAIVVPDGVTLGMTPAEIFDQLTYLDRRLSATSRYTQVTIVVSRENFTEVRGNARDSDIVIARAAARQNITPIWLHEYIHTRQVAFTRPDMDWWTEATAEYLAGRLLLEMGAITPTQYNKYLKLKRQRAPDGVVLAAPDTWRNDSTYSRGFVVLAALDARLQNTTNGSVTFLDVFRTVNQRDDLTDLAAFVHLLEQLTGASWQRWSDRYIAETAHPPLATVATTDSDGGAKHAARLLSLVLVLFLLYVLARARS